jgi:hypothetical protein
MTTPDRPDPPAPPESPPRPAPPKEQPERYVRLCVTYEDGQEFWCDLPEEEAADACRVHTDHLLNPGNVLPVAHGRLHSLNLAEARFVYACPVPQPPSGGWGDGGDDDDDHEYCPVCHGG